MFYENRDLLHTNVSHLGDAWVPLIFVCCSSFYFFIQAHFTSVLVVGLCCVLTVILVSIILAVTVNIVSNLLFFLNISTCFRCGCCPGRGPGPGTRTAPTTPPATAWTPWSPWPPGTRVSTRPACQTSGLFVTCRAHLSGRKWQTNDANSPWIVILPSLTIPEHKKCPVLTLIYQWMWLWLCPDEVRPQTRCQQHRMWGPQCQPPPALRGPDILHCGQEN